MRRFLNVVACIALAGLALSSADSAAVAETEFGPPDWKVAGYGTTDGPGDGSAPDVDEFSGISSHLGRFTGEGAHLLNPVDFSFEGHATYTAANGDQLFVEYAGQVTEIDLSQEFPFQFVAEDVEIIGGTGRLAGAEGWGVMTGAFSGIPGEFYFVIEGTLGP